MPEVTNSLYRLYTAVSQIYIPKGFEIRFGFTYPDEQGKTGCIKITVTELDTGSRMSWVVSPTEIENCKMDFIRDHVEGLIEKLWEDE